MTNTADFQGERMREGRLEMRPFGLMKLRELARDGVMVRKLTIGEALKELESIPARDEMGRARVRKMTKTVRAQFFLSPSGADVYTLKPTTRVIDGRKVKMLSIKSVTPVGAVLSLEVK
jgi:hypothetical protein